MLFKLVNLVNRPNIAYAEVPNNVTIVNWPVTITKIAPLVNEINCLGIENM